MTDHAANAEKVLKKYDRESNTAHYTGWPKKIIAAIAITFSVFQLYTAIFGVLDAQLQRAIHLGFGLALAYLLYPFRRAWTRDHYFHPIDIVFAVLGAATPAYLVIQYRELITRAGTVSPVDTVVGGLGILLVIEATRRVVGLPMVTVVLAFIAYAFLGPYMPGVLAHRGLTPEQLIGHLYFTTEGIFGIPLGVSSTFIFLFILFGAYLESTGLGKFFIDLANAVAGWASGGPAKVAVLSSGLMGTVSGSSVANVVGTGSLTIPMMKKLGYNANFAGAVEAAASTGGQLMPPVMGAAAFLMAEFVGVPYIDVVKAAAIPALLYFTGVWLGVHFEAKRKKLKGIPRAELPNPLTLLKERGHLAIPLIVIVYLLVSGYTPMRAALVAIFLSILCEREELCVNIVIGDAVCRENLTHIRLDARAGRTDRDTLALEIGNALDARGLERHELAGLGIERGNPLQTVHLLAVEHLRARHGVVRNIVLHRREVDGLVAQHIDICHRRARALRTRVHAWDLLVQDLGNRAADRVVGTRRAARADVEELLRRCRVAAAAGEECSREYKDCTCRKKLLYGRDVHVLSLLKNERISANGNMITKI